MFGRALFALAWLTIAAGLLLPFFPRDVATPSAANVVRPVAGFGGFACEDCLVADAGVDCQTGCACAQVLLIPAALVENAISLTIFVIDHPQPSGLPSGPQPLPPKLPAI
jgi:hypothetical protein